MNNLPTFPGIQELAVLWPLWLVALMFFFVWQWSGFMDRQTRRWHRMKLDQEIKHQTQSHVDA